MLTIWLDGWFSSAFNIIELIKNNPDKKPIKVIASHHKDMGYKVLCDEFYLREDFPENDQDDDYKNWAIEFAKAHNVDIFFPRKYFGTLYNAHRDFTYINGDLDFKTCKLVLPGALYEGYNNMFVPIFEDKLETQCCLGDFEALEKYELPCWDFHDVSQIEEFKQALKLSNFNFNKLCMKPKKGTGAQGFRILDYPYDVWKIRDILQRSGQEFILMPYLEGEELSIDFLRKDNKTLFVPRRKNRKNRIQEIVFDDGIKEICNDIEKSGLPDVMEVVGNVQFMKHNGKYYLLEVNCRMSGGVHLDSLAGVNFPYLLIKKILEEEFELPEVKECKVCNVERGVKVQ